MSENKSFYQASCQGDPISEALQGRIDTDVCVIGAGFTGLSAALHLAERGYSVVVLEREEPGFGASGRNGGQVGSGQRCDIMSLEKRFGHEQAKFFWDIAEEAKAIVQMRIRDYHIDCDYQPGNLLAITKRRYIQEIFSEAEILERDYGYTQHQLLSQSQIRDVVASDAYVSGVMDHGGGHLHPLKFARGLARAAVERGVKIFNRSPAEKIHWGSTHQVDTPNGQVWAKYLLFCGNAYLGDRLEPRISGRIMPIVNHILATEPLPESRARDIIANNCSVHSSKFVVDYFRFSADHRFLFGGGETYSETPPKDLKAFVRRYMLKVFPQLSDVEIDYAWSGRLAISFDRMPEFGRVGSNGFFAHGFSGHGVALSQLAGRLLAEVVAGQAERFDVYAAIKHRKFPGGEVLRHPLLVAGMLYYSLKDKF